MCFYDDDIDPARVWREADRKARKPHRCHECRGPIAPGETYRYYSWISNDGHPGQFKECPRCREVRKLIHDAEIREGCREYESWCPLGQLADAIAERDDGYGLLAAGPGSHADRVVGVAVHLFSDRMTSTEAQS